MRFKYLWLLPAALYAQTGTVTVEVRDATTNTPVAGVELKLARSSAPLPNWSARTDVDGKAAFDHLPAGSFYLEATHEGYLDSRITGPSQYVLIKEGAPAEDIKLRLIKSTALEGRVLDQEGRSMAGVRVHAAWTEATSDAEGRFRLENLHAGPCQLDFRVPMEVRKKTLARNPESGTLLGYPAVEFYPGVATAAEAETIQVAAGMDLHGYEVRLRRMQLADLTGRTLQGPHEPLAGVHVELQAPGDKTPILDETVGSDGRFRFELIPPGSYELQIYRGENETGLPYIVPIEVGKNGVRDNQIVVPPWQTIRGMVHVKDGEAWSGQVSVLVLAIQKGVIGPDIWIIARTAGAVCVLQAATSTVLGLRTPPI